MVGIANVLDSSLNTIPVVLSECNLLCGKNTVHSQSKGSSFFVWRLGMVLLVVTRLSTSAVS